MKRYLQYQQLQTYYLLHFIPIALNKQKFSIKELLAVPSKFLPPTYQMV